MKIHPNVLLVLDAARLDGGKLFLEGQLDRKLYVEVAKVLEAAGGKWNRKAKAHVFDGDAAEAVEPILLTGEVTRTKKDFGQFFTPPGIAAHMVDLADLRDGHRVLEPSAGGGAIWVELRGRRTAVEIDTKLADRLREKCTFGDWGVAHGDFLLKDPESVGGPFDRIVMNPPFGQQADIKHVMHAWTFLKPGGRLVSIMSSSVTYRSTSKAVEFRAFIQKQGGTIETMPSGAFKSSGTDVSTVMVAFDA